MHAEVARWKCADGSAAYFEMNKKIRYIRTSLVAQWITIHLPIQGTWVQSSIWEDPTCLRATKPLCHNYWACAPEPGNRNCWARELKLLKPMCPRTQERPTREATVMRSPYTTTKRSPVCCNWRKHVSSNKDPVQPKITNKCFKCYISWVITLEITLDITLDNFRD